MRPNGARGFTLVEALIAVAVVVALIGILVPTVGYARGAARSAMCMSNARQLSVANTAFALDNSGRCAPAAWGPPGRPNPNLHRWHGERDRADQPFDPSRGVLTAYLGDALTSEGVRACPTFAPTLRRLRESGEGFEAGAGGYGYNSAFVGVDRPDSSLPPRHEKGSRRDRFRSPARTIEFGDAAFAGDDGIIEYSFLEPSVWPEYPDYRPDPSMHFRHAGKAIVSWLDGHASAHERTSTNWSGVYSTDPGPLGIGWFGPDDSNELYDYE